MLRILVQHKTAMIDRIAQRTAAMAMLGLATSSNPTFIRLMKLHHRLTMEIDRLLKAAEANPHLWYGLPPQL